MCCGISEVSGMYDYQKTYRYTREYESLPHFPLKIGNIVIIARQMNKQLLEENQQLKNEKEELTRTYDLEKLDFQHDAHKLVKMTRELMIEIIFLHTHTDYLYSTLRSPLHAMQAYSQRMGTSYPVPRKLDN